MNIYEHDRYPWLLREKIFISEAMANHKMVLGICLGAQLLADVLDGKVHKNEQKEIGWHTVQLTPAAKSSRIFRFYLRNLWHSIGMVTLSPFLHVLKEWQRVKPA